jgi:integrase
MFQVAEGKDPQAEKKAQRALGTFEELASQYVEQYARKNNKSWEQAAALVRKHLLPRWGKLRATDISRADVKTLIRSIQAPAVANQVLASASAIFTWAIKEEVGGIEENPCRLVDRNETRSRERVLSDSELPRFWQAFGEAGLAGTALKLVLLTGQRPGEVSHMRAEHIESGWWTMPGEPVPALSWPIASGCRLLPRPCCRNSMPTRVSSSISMQSCGRLAVSSGSNGRPRMTCVARTAPPSPL